MTEDYEFISNVAGLATNGTLAELMRRIEEDQVRDWRAAREMDDRERCWHVLEGIRLLRDKIESLVNEEKVRDWVNRRAARRS